MMQVKDMMLMLLLTSTFFAFLGASAAVRARGTKSVEAPKAEKRRKSKRENFELIIYNFKLVDLQLYKSM